jgi:hypothetical protein
MNLFAAGVNLVLEQEIRALAEALRAAGVEPILLKGPPLVRWLYGSDARPSSDVDLLVARANFPAAEETLGRLGFVPFLPGEITGDRPRHAQAWHRTNSPISVDLHQNLIGVGTPPEVTWSILSERCELVDFSGIAVETLAPPARLMHVALHAAQHGPDFSSSMRDLAAAIERMPIDLWKEAGKLAERLDALAAFNAALELVPSERITRVTLGLPRRRTVEAELHASGAPDLALGLEWLARTGGGGARFRVVARKAFPPSDWMRDWLPSVAGRGRTGLVAAYGWRLLWLVWHFPPAFVAWRQARREVER